MQVTPFSISGILIQYIPTITSESQIQVGRVSNLAIRGLIHPSQSQLTASPRTLGIVFRSQSLSVRAWECHRTRSEDIYLFPIKGIERSRQTIIEETKIQTTIISSRGCPCQGIVRSRSSHNRICQVITKDIFFTQLILLQIRERIHLVNRVLAQIHIITRRTIRGTDLQITQPIRCRLHERLLADTPCGRYRGEEAPTLTVWEKGITIVTERKFCYILLIKCIIETADPRKAPSVLLLRLAPASQSIG